MEQVSEGRKRITITATFYYTYTSAGKPVRSSATANQEAELETRTAGPSRAASIRRAYALMRCPGPPCTKESDHCLQHEGKHFPLRPHHVRMIAEQLQAGKILNGHDDVPDNIRQLVLDDEREREEREQREKSRKRKRRDSDGSSHDRRMIHCRCTPINTAAVDAPSTPRMVFPTTPVVELNMPREDAVRAYNQWQRSKVSTEEQKQYYDSALDLTLAHCYDLKLLAANQERMYRFYTQHGIPDGVAWRYVCDIHSFLTEYERSKAYDRPT